MRRANKEPDYEAFFKPYDWIWKSIVAVLVLLALMTSCVEDRPGQDFKEERDTVPLGVRTIPGQDWSNWSPNADSGFVLLSQNYADLQERLVTDDTMRSWIGSWVRDSVPGDGAGSNIGTNLIPYGQGSSTLTAGDLSWTNVTKRLNIGASGDRMEIDGDDGAIYYDASIAGFFEANQYFFDDRIVAGGASSHQFIVDSQGDSVLITKELSSAAISIQGDTINLYGVAKYNGSEIPTDNFATANLTQTGTRFHSMGGNSLVFTTGNVFGVTAVENFDVTAVEDIEYSAGGQMVTQSTGRTSVIATELRITADSVTSTGKIVAGTDLTDQFIVDSQGDSMLITKESSNAVISIKGDTINLYGVTKTDSIMIGGISILSGTTAPSSSIGSQGSLYMRDDNDSTLYTKTGTGWVLIN